jgi:O-antigen/teichoic acid export membrane protein
VEDTFNWVKGLATSATAKDTYLMYVGNLLSAFIGFLFVLVIARNLTVDDFGIFSAANNLIIIIASLTDIGISSAVVKFVSEKMASDDKVSAYKYIKAGFVLRFWTVLTISFLVFLLSGLISKHLLATDEIKVAWWVAIISLGMFSWGYFQYVFQAFRKFVHSIITDISLGTSRVLLTLIFVLGGLKLNEVFGAYFAATIVSLVVIAFMIRLDFLKSRPDKQVYKKLLKFSGWLGVNRVISSISGRLDVQMLAALAGATQTGFYSIPSRLAFFIPVLAGSFTSVLAPRLSSFGDKEKEIRYVKKATLAVLPISIGIVVWIALAKPFIVILFGQKYLPAVPVFQALAAAMIPFLFTVPSVSAIIYAIKKPIYIGIFAFFQLAAIFLLNLYFIPRMGALGPTVTLGIVNTILALYSWVVVLKHYL